MRTNTWIVALVGVLGMSWLGCDQIPGLGELTSDGDNKDSDDDDKDDKDDDDSDEDKAEAPDRFDDKLFEVGDTAELTGLDLKLKKIKSCTYEKDNWQKSMEDKGEKLIAAQFIFEGTGEQMARVTSSFRAHDEDSIVFKTVSLSGTDCTPALSAIRLKASEKAKGWIGFKVPKDVEGLTTRYEHKPEREPGAKTAPDPEYPEFSLED